MNLDDVVEPGWWWWSSSRSQDSLHILKECGTCQAELIHLKQKPLCNQGINCTSHYTSLLGIPFTSVFKTTLSCTWLSTCSAYTCSVLREPIQFSILFQSINWHFNQFTAAAHWYCSCCLRQYYTALFRSSNNLISWTFHITLLLKKARLKPFSRFSWKSVIS